MKETVILWAYEGTLSAEVLEAMSKSCGRRFSRSFTQVQRKPSGTSRVYRGTITSSEGEAVPVAMHVLKEDACTILPEAVCSMQLKDSEKKGRRHCQYERISVTRGILHVRVEHRGKEHFLGGIVNQLTAACTRFDLEDESPFGALPKEKKKKSRPRGYRARPRYGLGDQSFHAVQRRI